MRIYKILIFSIFLIGCATPVQKDDWHPSRTYIERGWIRNITPSLKEDSTFYSTPKGVSIAFERESPKGQLTSIVVWGNPPIWIGLHCEITIFHGCNQPDNSFSTCGDWITDVRRLDQ